ncbi:Acg family FMN-binding oxidoreductase [Rhodococcus sp. UNC363MFTsu5.1]|uniref:Acg family FMN-binding oxidoreductase n=1 Tax=Rhodococcus sp. UNC363MFTsu5.1 TaxID=1449069 RepID=UPI00048960DB|nr:nitroreductase family protein [Rhodococcus sp. UNC363MFTsu5.1]
MDTAGPDTGVIQSAVDLACRAPSVHNSQPWHWRYSSGRLDLFSDRTRLLPSTDPSGRQLHISCGAALHHVEVALTSLRWRSDIDLLPEPSLPRLVASIRCHRDATPRSHDFDLVSAIRHRRTDRRPFDPVSAAAGPVEGLADPVGRFGVALTVLAPEARTTLAAATDASAAARRYDSDYQAELHWWAGHSLPTEGIPPDSLATSDESARVSIGRAFPHPGRQESTPRPGVDQSTVLMLSTDSDTAAAWTRCGQALSAVLLEATSRGMATCPLTHLTDVERSRDMIAGLAPHGGFPQVLLRVGSVTSPPPAGHTPRRSTADVLTLH